MDVKGCAERGTLEQRQIAREVREIMEEVWALDKDAPVRRLLDALCSSTASQLESSVGSATPAVVTAQRGKRFPHELIDHTMRFLLPDPEDWPQDIEVAALGSLRAVSRFTKGLAETLFPNTLHRYITRIVRRVLHLPGHQTSMHPSRLAYTCGPLFGEAFELAIFFVGDEVDALNALLPVFTRLEKLTIFLTSGSTTLQGVNFCPCPLKSLRIEGVDISEEGRRTHFSASGRAGFRDVYVERQVSEIWRIKFEPIRLLAPVDSLEIGRLPFDENDRAEMLYALFRQGQAFTSVIFGFKLSSTDPLWIRYVNVPSRVEFGRWCINDAMLQELDLGSKGTLEELVINEDSIKNPGALALSDNQNLVRLTIAHNKLQPAALDLDSNEILRYLDLSGCFKQTEDGIVAAMDELCAQLGENGTLKELVLADNGITDEAARKLRLATNKGLRKLSIGSNLVTDSGLRAMLKGNSSLVMLNVRGNKVTRSCAVSLSTGGRTVVQGKQDRRWEEYEVSDSEDEDSDSSDGSAD